jgi:hypothetical protein
LKVIFCYNQVSYIIAKNIENNLFSKNILVISENRIERTGKKSGVIELNYSSFFTLIILLFSIIPFGLEIVIPHTKGGKILKILAKYAYKLSYVDDGMDTFREVPKNIELSVLSKGTNYFTFDYGLPVANWLKEINQIKVISVSNLEDDYKPSVDLRLFSHVIIESPGISAFDFSLVDSSYFIIKHPNPKKSIESLKFNSSQNGRNISVENSLKTFRGELILGETLILVYLLSINYDLSKTILCLNRSDYDNLNCLHPLFLKCKKLLISDKC